MRSTSMEATVTGSLRKSVRRTGSFRMRSTAIGAVFGTILAASAFGQARVNNGNALDANNRIGSGGFNQGAGGDRYRGPYAGYTANDVINANVTAGKAFRGPVPYRDP